MLILSLLKDDEFENSSIFSDDLFPNEIMSFSSDRYCCSFFTSSELVLFLSYLINSILTFLLSGDEVSIIGKANFIGSFFSSFVDIDSNERGVFPFVCCKAYNI